MREGLLPCKSLVAACLYGQSPDFLDAGDACVGVTAVVAMPADTRGWLQRPQTEEQGDTSRGQARAKRGVAASPHAPCSVAALAARLPASRWYQRTVAEGTQGPST